MVKIFRLVTLFLEVLLQQFVNGVGIAALMLAVAAGFLRATPWSILALALVFGLGVDPFERWFHFSDKAESASLRWLLMVGVYLVIALGGYLTGVFCRRHLERRSRKKTQAIR
jgi:hypothetical protein